MAFCGLELRQFLPLSVVIGEDVLTKATLTQTNTNRGNGRSVATGKWELRPQLSHSLDFSKCLLTPEAVVQQFTDL